MIPHSIGNQDPMTTSVFGGAQVELLFSGGTNVVVCTLGCKVIFPRQPAIFYVQVHVWYQNDGKSQSFWAGVSFNDIWLR